MKLKNLSNEDTVLITGHESMIGRQVLAQLDSLGINYCYPYKVNLIYSDVTKKAFDRLAINKVTYVMHLAGFNGGIDFNKTYPADIFYNTVKMGLNTINLSVKSFPLLKKILFIMPSCALEPQEGESFEYNLYSGPAHPSVECHGLAKRAVEAYGRQVAKQYNIDFISVIANNSFGPYDRFDALRGKVISGLIRRFVEALEENKPNIEIWGTGSPLREFIYCKDVAYGLIEALDKYKEKEPINLTSDYEISIKDLAYKIKQYIGYKGDIIFDTSKSDGQMRKKLNSDKMHQYLNVPITDFDKALEETIKWYMENRKCTQ